MTTRLLVLSFALAALALVAPAAATAQCNVDCAMETTGSGEPIGYTCVTGSNENCNPENDETGWTCWYWECPAPVAILNEIGVPFMTVEACPSVNNGEVTLTPIAQPQASFEDEALDSNPLATESESTLKGRLVPSR